MSAQGYGVCYGFGEVGSLTKTHGDEVVRERAQTFESRLVAREEGKSATAFVLFLFEKIHNFDCAVTIFTQKH